MRLRGGGIGHKATREWDEILFQDAGWAVVEDEPMDDEDGTDVEEEEEDDDDEGELEAWGYTNPAQEDDENLDEGDGYLGQGDASDSDEGPDRVVADEGEELDDDVYRCEGYGAL